MRPLKLVIVNLPVRMVSFQITKNCWQELLNKHSVFKLSTRYLGSGSEKLHKGGII